MVAGIAHIVMTVGDADRSRRFYRDVVGFDVTDVHDGFRMTVGDTTIWCFPSPRPVSGDRFSEFRIGLDHLSFLVETRAELERYAERFRAHRVDTKGIETFAPTGTPYIAFRDPDNIQLELWLVERREPASAA